MRPQSVRLTGGAPLAMFLLALAALAAPWLGGHDPWDPATADLADALRPPAWAAAGDARFRLGTDPLGRDLLSLTLYGLRVSLAVGVGATALAATVGVAVGLAAALGGAAADAVLMRVTDAHLTFPPLVAALLADAVLLAVAPTDGRLGVTLALVGGAVGWSQWPAVARVVRTAARVEVQRDYVTAARACGASRLDIAWRHLTPNLAPVVAALALTGLGQAVLAEATLSFLGLGVPADTPSLGTLVRYGADHALAGRWWLAAAPGVVLAALGLTLGAIRTDGSRA